MSQLSLPTRGRWTLRAGVWVWRLPPRRTPEVWQAPRVFDPDLIACECGATVTQTCKTVGGNPTTDHTYRAVSRRCLCGALLDWKKQYCEPCRAAANKQTGWRRERRTPTRTRRRGT